MQYLRLGIGGTSDMVDFCFGYWIPTAIYHLSLSFGCHTTVGNMTPGFKETKKIMVGLHLSFGCCTTVHNVTPGFCYGTTCLYLVF